MGSNFFDIAQQAIESARSILKPGVDAALPIVKQAGEEALKVASPTISEASKKALEALEGSGIDTEPVLSAAKVLTPWFRFSYFTYGFLCPGFQICDARLHWWLKPVIMVDARV